MTVSVKAYVLIVARPGKTREVVSMVRNVNGVREAHEVMGPYDIVVEVVVEEPDGDSTHPERSDPRHRRGE